ncbi:MAG: GSCFA domain-containing protein [Polaribacter sp.]|nr:GSCFA domain-containing protein [Polaribacter sp.]
MNLQTHIPFTKNISNLIDYNSKIILLGSCFSDNIGQKLSYHKFESILNPFGILFHPKAIESVIKNALCKKKYTEKDVFFLNERWQSFEAHSKLSSSSKEEIIEQLNKASVSINKAVKNSTHFIITLGTSWVYRSNESGEIVANCHKVSQNKFKKELLSVAEINKSLSFIISLIKEINPSISFIFTVSPVRHLKDGVIENQQSKSHLISALHQIIPIHKNSFYFPSYEVMMDELRDYRFYKEDMIHPNQIAINYIWEKFYENWLSDEALELKKEVIKIQRGLEHKPFNPNSEGHQQFLSSLQEKIKTLKKKYSHISF